MDYQRDKKYFIDDNKKTNGWEEFSRSNDDDFAFVPVENIRRIEQVIGNLMEVKQRLNKMKS